MARTGARVAIVALGAVALLPSTGRATPPVGLSADPATISTPNWPSGSMPMMLFSFFNSDDGNISIQPDAAMSTCTAGFTFSVLHTPHNTTFPVILAPSEIVQILGQAPALTMTTTCTEVFDIDSSGGGPIPTIRPMLGSSGGSSSSTSSVDITVNIGSAGSNELVVEPEAGLDFGTRITVDQVTQTVRIVNFGGSADTLTATTSLASHNIALGPGPDDLFTCVSGSGTTCTAALGVGQFADLFVTCAAQDTQTPGLTISDTEGNSVPVAITCAEQQTSSGITFGSAVVLAGTSGIQLTGSGAVSGSSTESMSDAYIIAPGTSIAFASTDPACSGTYCTFGSGRATPGQLSFQCTPETAQPDQTGLVIVHGFTDLDPTVGMLSCTTTGGTTGAALDVSPSSLAYGTVGVGQSVGPMEVTIGDPSGASQPLTDVSVTIDDPTDYSLDCGSSCQFASIAAGASVMVGVTFTPTQGAPLNTTLHVTATDATAQTVTITAAGDATGPAPDVQTDFYACGCHGAGPPVQGWPIAVVIVGVARRRRRRSPSA